MKRLHLWALVLLALVAPRAASAQVLGSATLTVESTCATFAVGNIPSVTLQVTTASSFTGTLEFSGSADGTNYAAIEMIDLSDSATPVTSATAVGQFSRTNPGLIRMRACTASGWSGSATVTGTRGSGIVARAGGASLTLASVLAVFTGTPDGTKILRDDGAWIAAPGGGDALTANPLSQFAATTSAQLRGVLSDEVGTGPAYFQGGALGTPASGTATNLTGLPVATGISGLGTGVATALAVNVGSAGAPVLFNGALGTPSSGTATNLTGLPVATGISGLGTGVATALAVNVGSAGAPVVFNGALGTPASGTATNLTGLPPAGITFAASDRLLCRDTASGGAGEECTGAAAAALIGLTNILAQFTGTPDGSKFLRDDGAWTAIPGGGDALTANPLSQFAATTSAQLRGVLSDEVGTGPAYFQGGALGTPASGTATNLTGLPVATGISGLGTGVATALAATPDATGGFVTFDYVDANFPPITGTPAQGDTLYYDGADWQLLVKSTTAGHALRNTGTNNNPAWGLVDVSAVTGDLALANLAQGSALSVLGVTGNSTADNASIAAGSDHQVLRRSGTALAFGAVNLAQSAAVTGELAVANGGSGAATLTGLLQGNGTSAFTAITDSTTVGQVLRVTGSNTYGWGAVNLADSDAITGTLPAANAPPSRIFYNLANCQGTTGTVAVGTFTSNAPTAECFGTNVREARLIFPDTTALTEIQGSFVLPSTFSSITANLKWSSAGTGNAVPQFWVACTASGEAPNDTWVATTPTTSAQLDAGDDVDYSITLTTTGCAGNERFSWRLGRENDHGSDTLNDTWRPFQLFFEIVR